MALWIGVRRSAGCRGQPQQVGGIQGRDTWLELPAETLSDLRHRRFTVSAWIHTDAAMVDVPGDIVSQYDPVRKRAFICRSRAMPE